MTGDLPVTAARGQARFDAPASRRINAIAGGLWALILLCIAALVATMLAGSREALDMAKERERAQIANALATRFEDMRSDLTSVTFWDEAVEKTAVAFDRGWAEENVGLWLSDFYQVEESFLLDGADRPALATRNGRTVAATAYDRYRRIVAPMAVRVRAKVRGYRPGDRFAGDRTRKLDEARLALVDGRPAYVVAAAILPDFGRIDGRSGPPYLVVAVHAIDTPFLTGIGRGVLVPRIRLAAASESRRGGEEALRLIGSGRSGFEVRWTADHEQTDLLTRFAPIVAASMLAILLAGGAGVMFVRRTAGRLYHSRHEATHDELTGLPNRRLLTRRIEQAVASGERLALLFIDLDRFKDVNDLWGHAAGDELLRSASRRLAAIPGLTQVARFGGDEFVVLIEGWQDDTRLGDAILAALRQPYDIAGSSVVLAGSIGLAVAPDQASSASELMRKADLALYRAKELGKDRFVLFDQAMEQQLRDRQQLENELRDGLSRGEITVAYQPYFTATGEIAGVEALARWAHPIHGEIIPGRFLPLAQETRLIRELDRIVLAAACAEAARWRSGMLSVNVSTAELRSPGFVGSVRRLTEKSGLPPDRLRLEITQSTHLLNGPSPARTLAELRAMGVRIMLDDFGSGHSSFGHLQKLPIDGIKFDLGFVAGMTGGNDCPELLTAMIAFGHALGLTVAIKRIETTEQLALLRAAGCDEFQGYALGRATSAETIRARLTCLPRSNAA